MRYEIFGKGLKEEFEGSEERAIEKAAWLSAWHWSGLLVFEVRAGRRLVGAARGGHEVEIPGPKWLEGGA